MRKKLRSGRNRNKTGFYTLKTGVLRPHGSTVPAAPPIRILIPIPKPNPKTHRNPNTIFNPNRTLKIKEN